MTTIAAPLPTNHAMPEQAPPRLPDDGPPSELVDGQVVEKPVSDLAQLVANTLNDELVVWARQTRLGRSFVETTYQCFPHAPGMVRRPDVSYVTNARLAGYQWGQGHFTIAPDLAVEVVSPSDQVYDLDRKLADYFKAGVRRVWVINPDQQTVRIHRAPGGDISELVGDAELTDEAVLPGFRCPLSTLFTQPASTAQSAP